MSESLTALQTVRVTHVPEALANHWGIVPGQLGIVLQGVGTYISTRHGTVGVHGYVVLYGVRGPAFPFSDQDDAGLCVEPVVGAWDGECNMAVLSAAQEDGQRMRA